MRKVPEVIIETVEDEHEATVELPTKTIDEVDDEAEQVRKRELEEYLDSLRLQLKMFTDQKELEVKTQIQIYKFRS